jgi:hypothetical protein
VAVAGGALVTMQRYDAFYLLAPAFDVLRVAWSAGAEAPRRLLRLAPLVAAAALLGALPLLAMGLGRGEPLFWQADLFSFNLRYWSEPRVAEVLFASRGGWLAWTPAAALGLLGLLRFARRQPALGYGILVALASGLYLLGSNWSWAASWAFGARRLTEFAPVLALGLASALEWLLLRPRLGLTLGLALLVAWNVTLVGLVQRGVVPQDATFSFGSAARAGLSDAHAAFGNPAAFPAPWLYGWRRGVDPGRFDDLFGRDASREWVARLGAAGDAKLVGRGWSAPLPGGGRSVVASRATLLVVLPRPDACVLRLSAGVRPGDAAVLVAVDVNERLAATFTAPGELAASLPEDLFRPGDNELALRPAPGSQVRLDAVALRCGPAR